MSIDFTLIAQQIQPKQFARILGSEKIGSNYRCPRPSHHTNGDQHPSFSVFRSNGKTCAKCHSCDLKGDVVGVAAEVWGLDLPAAGERLAAEAGITNGSRASEEYVYHLKDETPALKVTRGAGKQFLQAAWTGTQWDFKAPKPKLLYRLDEIAQHSGKLVFIVEGEKDADTLSVHGLISTTNPGGAGKWLTTYTESLQGHPVAVLFDNDEPGRIHALTVAESCLTSGIETRVITLPGIGDLGNKKDVSDWLAEGHTVDDLKQLVRSTGLLTRESFESLKADWQPEGRLEVLERDTEDQCQTQAEPESPQWPTLQSEALYGLAGDLVKLISPHTEADPAALLVQFLVCFGSAINRGAWFEVEADRHHFNLFATLVGDSAKGRKGVSLRHVKRVFKSADKNWVSRIASGLSTGEGLIWHVRDPIQGTRSSRGQSDGYETITTDAGVDDKRLMVVEEELARTLKAAQRDTNTLSAVVRNAWDSGDLSTLTRSSPAKATGAHISIVGHITSTELLRYLDSTDCANGFANRFLWICVRRSKYLPEGGQFHNADLGPYASRLKAAIEFSATAGELCKDKETKMIWAEAYDELSTGKPGLLGAVIGRAEAQVMRLAGVYALLDLSKTIRKEHLIAALALWDYAESSARFIFGEKLGDPVADELLAALRDVAPEGMSRTEISNLFGRNKKSLEISKALETLARLGLAKNETAVIGGRSGQKWFCSRTKRTN